MEGRRVEDMPSSWEEEDVQIGVYLPKDILKQAREVNREDPGFLSRIVLFGLTRRAIYHHLREVSGEEESSITHYRRGSDFNFSDTVYFEFDLTLPSEIAKQAGKVQREDPEFLSRVLYYGLSRYSIYRQLSKQSRIPLDNLLDS